MEPTAEFAHLQLRFTDPTQRRYEMIRPLLLFEDRTATQRAQETETHPDTVRTFLRRFRQQGMLGLLPDHVEVSPRGRASRVPEAVRQEIARLKALYGGFHYREVVRIIFSKFGYRLHPNTVKQLWQQDLPKETFRRPKWLAARLFSGVCIVTILSGQGHREQLPRAFCDHLARCALEDSQMPALLHIFLSVLSPVLLIASSGYCIVRLGVVTETRSLSRIALYIFLPALIFTVLAQSRLATAEYVMLVLLGLLMASIQGVLGWGLARSMALDRLTTSAFLLSITLANTNAYGFAVNQFAFGTDGLVSATVYHVGATLFTYSIGTFIAARGSCPLRVSLLQMAKMPPLYAAVAGLIVNRLGWTLPDLALRPLHLAGSAAIPTMLLLLGIELARARVIRARLPLSLAVGLKLVAGPLIALGLTHLLGLHGVTRSVVIVQGAMPTGVVAALIAAEFDAQPAFVSSAVVVTTFGSLVTLTLLLGLLC